jgi:hypothetical protein
VFSYTLPYQLSSGDWSGYQGYVWYQSILLRSLISAYVAIPFTLEYSGKKDKLALAIISAANWFAVNQRPDGSFPITRAGGSSYPAGERDMVSFDGKSFARTNDGSVYPGHGAYEIDALVALYRELKVEEVLPVLNGYATLVSEAAFFWRLEFNTFGAGAYLGFLSDYKSRPAASLLAAPPENTFFFPHVVDH